VSEEWPGAKPCADAVVEVVAGTARIGPEVAVVAKQVQIHRMPAAERVEPGSALLPHFRPDKFHYCC